MRHRAAPMGTPKQLGQICATMPQTKKRFFWPSLSARAERTESGGFFPTAEVGSIDAGLALKFLANAGQAASDDK